MDSAISNSIKSILNFGFNIVSFWFKLWLLPINSIFEWIQERVKPILSPLFSFLQTHKTKLLKYSLLSIVYLGFLLFVTLVSYYALYSTLVPKVSTEEQLFFDYNYKSTKKIVADVQASVEFQKNKHYSIFLELELPDSPKNQDIGMFMACMDIDDHDKWNPQKIHHTCRPAMLKYSSGLLKYIKSFIMSVPYLFGMYEEKQTIALSMGDNFVANRYYQTISAHIQINNPDIQIYKASLKFLANLNGFDYYLYYFPITSFIIGCSIIYISLLSSSVFMVASLYIYRYFKYYEENQQQKQERIIDNELSDEEEIDSIYSSLVGEEPSSSSSAKPSIFADSATTTTTIKRRNGANYKRKPIWEIEDEDDDNIKLNSGIDSSGSGSGSGKPGNEDSLGIFASPKITKDSKFVVNSELYKELDEAFSGSGSGNNNNTQKDFKNTINNNNYSWDQELKDIDSILDEKQKQHEQKYKEQKELNKTPSSPPLKQQPTKTNSEFDYKNNNNSDDIQSHSNLILSTSEHSTPVQHSNNNNNNNNQNNIPEEQVEKEQIAPSISIESSSNSITNLEEETNNENDTASDSPVNISSPSDSDNDDDDKNTKSGNSGEWVKVVDSSIRKRKN